MRHEWQFEIRVKRDAAVPPFLQVARALTDDVRRGRLQPGDRLPGSRELAAAAGVHRNTILAAYAELIAQGWLEAVQGSGTFVVHTLPESPAPDAPRGASASRRAGFTVAAGPEVYRPPILPRGTL